MGWNSWDSYGTTVREAQVKANADWMAEHLAKYGWKYIVVDIQWYEPNAQGHDYKPGAPLTMDEYGRLIPAAQSISIFRERGWFQAAGRLRSQQGTEIRHSYHARNSAPGGRKEPSDQRHAVFTRRILPTRTIRCEWNPDMWGVDTTKPGSQAYYDSIAELYASWGVDFIKADDMGSHLYQPAELKALSTAIRKTSRDDGVEHFTRPGADSRRPRFFEKYAQMWRISDDFWDEWKLLRKQFDYMRDWAEFVGKNSTWPDADMLPLGRLRVTENGRRRRSDEVHGRRTADTNDPVEHISLAVDLWRRLAEQ